MSLVVPAVLAGAAVAVAVGLPAPRRSLFASQGPRAARRVGPAALPLATFAVLLVPVGPVAAAVAALVASVGRRGLVRRRRRAERARERLAAREALAVLAAELRAGRAPSTSLLVAADVAAGPTARALAEAGGSSTLGAGAAESLARHAVDSAVPDMLQGLAVCWEVCQGTGSSLATSVERLEEAVRADLTVREEIESELEGARSTSILLAGLPVFALALGSSLGGHPVHVLLHKPVGWGCLCIGTALDLLGLWWTERIVRAAGGAS
jgi:tight adherence protein B